MNNLRNFALWVIIALLLIALFNLFQNTGNRAGVTDIGIIIAPQTGDEVREAVGDGSAFGARVTYIEQDEPAGLAHAVLTAEEFLDGSSFVMYLGDNLLREGVPGLVERFRAESPDAMILLTRVEDPSAFGVAELEGKRVVRLVEKPENPPSDMALVGVYLFSPAILEAARGLTPSDRGELEITEAIQVLIDEGREVHSEIVSGWWKDTGQLSDMLEANRLVLDDIETRLDGTIDNYRVEGRVIVEEGAVLRDSLVRGPAVIGRGALVEGAYIGPYTSIGDDVHVINSEIEHSIVLAGSVIRDLPARMEASLLGKDVTLTRSMGVPRTMQFLVGDKADIAIP